MPLRPHSNDVGTIPARPGGRAGREVTGSAGHYKSNVRDLEFNLLEFYGLGTVLDSGAFGDLDGDTARKRWPRPPASPEVPVAEACAETDCHPNVFDSNHTR